MSTHKWLGNIKTCAIIRVGHNAKDPEPVGISFGYPNDPHLWTGMLDYNPYILIGKILLVYKKYGK